MVSRVETGPPRATGGERHGDDLTFATRTPTGAVAAI
jgi:hypothetical protein